MGEAGFNKDKCQVRQGRHFLTFKMTNENIYSAYTSQKYNNESEKYY